MNVCNESDEAIVMNKISVADLHSKILDARPVQFSSFPSSFRQNLAK